MQRNVGHPTSRCIVMPGVDGGHDMAMSWQRRLCADVSEDGRS